MNDPPQTVAGIVLAGGKSTRMGRDKSLLPVGGTTLLGRTIRVLAGVFEEVLVVADRADRFGALGNVGVVEDLVPDIGPLGGIYTGLKESAKPACFVVACDMPLLDPGVISRQLGIWPAAGADALVPVVNGWAEPLHSVYGKGCLPAIERQIEQKDHRVRAVFDLVRVHFWHPAPEDAGAFANVNTPDEWAQLVDTGGLDSC